MRLSNTGFVALAVALTIQVLETQARVIFSSSPATGANLLSEAFLVGNGKLGGILHEA